MRTIELASFFFYLVTSQGFTFFFIILTELHMNVDQFVWEIIAVDPLLVLLPKVYAKRNFTVAWKIKKKIESMSLCHI